jgi:hypothetical protein
MYFYSLNIAILRIVGWAMPSMLILGQKWSKTVNFIHAGSIGFTADGASRGDNDSSHCEHD